MASTSILLEREKQVKEPLKIMCVRVEHTHYRVQFRAHEGHVDGLGNLRKRFNGEANYELAEELKRCVAAKKLRHQSWTSSHEGKDNGRGNLNLDEGATRTNNSCTHRQSLTSVIKEAIQDFNSMDLARDFEKKPVRAGDHKRMQDNKDGSR